MPAYEYESCDDLIDPDGNPIPNGAMVFEIRKASMKDCDPIGMEIPCPIEGFSGHIRRIFSLSNFIIAGTNTWTWNEGDTITTKTRDGEPIKYSFVDHKHTAPEYQRNLAHLAKQHGIKQDTAGLKNAYFSPKHNRVVVDVVSNVPDPLGKLTKNKNEGNFSQTKKKVNTPVKVRKQSDKPVERKATDTVLLPRRFPKGI